MIATDAAIPERIAETQSFCARNNPLYEQISNYSVALYVLGLTDAPDIVSTDDCDMTMAADILKNRFEPIDETEIPRGYCAKDSSDRYMVVLGDPTFPTHFAAVIDQTSDKPFFSKLKHMGSGYDNLEEMIAPYAVEEKIKRRDAQYYKAI